MPAIDGKTPLELDALSGSLDPANDVLIIGDFSTGRAVKYLINTFLSAVGSLVLGTRYEKVYTNTIAQTAFTFLAGDIGGNTNLANAKRITMFVEGLRVKSSEWSVTAALTITKTGAVTASEVVFEVIF